MLINEVCKKSNVTKKAIEYYAEHGLISPVIAENGYRQFSDDDVEKLKKISIMRGLGIPVAEIREVLENNSLSMLLTLLHKNELEMSAMKEKLEIMQQLVSNGNWENACRQMESLQNRQSILTRILDKFPGGYGQMVSLHFAPFLDEPIQTEEQRIAFEEIIDFLDNMKTSIPDDLQEYLAEAAINADPEIMHKASESLSAAMDNPQEFIENNKEMLNQYQAVLDSKEYKESPAYRLNECLKQLQNESGYQDIFIPAMLRLSPSYQEYYNSLQMANDVFKQFYNS